MNIISKLSTILFILIIFALPVRAQTDYCGQPCFNIPFPSNIPTPYNWKRLSCCHYSDPSLTCKEIGSDNYCVKYPENQCNTKEGCCVTPTINPTISPTITPSPFPTSSTNSWLDNNRSLIRNSAWFNQHQYSDCDNSFYPNPNILINIDCHIEDQGLGPSAQDKQIVKDPPNLYYKHLTPYDMMSVIGYKFINQQQLQKLDLWDIIMQKIINKVLQDPEKYANVSFDSLYINVEGGENGQIVRSLSLLVHPAIERPISSKIGSLQRAKNLYVPYVEGAVGYDVNDEDVHQLYLAALNRCGSAAIGDDQSGLGVKRDFGNYVGVVQWWSINQGGRYADCNIHLVRKPTTTPLKSQNKNIIDFIIEFIKKMFR